MGEGSVRKGDREEIEEEDLFLAKTRLRRIKETHDHSVEPYYSKGPNLRGFGLFSLEFRKALRDFEAGAS
jgi:hypothetical protein